MKEKIKQIILYFGIFYIVTITIMLIINILTSTKYIELSDQDENLAKLNELKQELPKLEQNECTNSINNLIIIYETTSYNGRINLQNYTNQDNFLEKFYETKEICQLTDEEFNQNYISPLVNLMITNENFLLDYRYQYKLHIPDIIWGDTRSILTYHEYFIIKLEELTIINNLIETIKERNNTHE